MSRSPFDDADLLERLLAGEDLPDAAEAEEARAFLAACRAALTEPDGALDTRDLRARVLRSTTREDLSWRGDLRLVGRFVRTRLVHSPALRMAAALLLLQLLLVPGVLAYLSLVRPTPREPDLRIDFELPTEPPPAAPQPDPALELAGPEEAAQALERALDGLRLEPDPDNARQWDRFHLEAGLPRTEAPAEHPVEAVLRARGWDAAPNAEDPNAEDLAGGPGAALADGDPNLAVVLAALRLEWALDRLGAGGDPDPDLAEDARALCGFVTAAQRVGGSEDVRLLAGAALARARALGLLSEPASGASARDGDPVAWLLALRRAEPHELLGPQLRRGGPAGPAWRALLGRVLDELGVDGPVARDWR